jgi:Protein of unknown function (DUF4058)
MASPFPGMDPYLERFWRDVIPASSPVPATPFRDRLPTDLIGLLQERAVFVPSDELVTERYIEIVEASSGRRVITVIKFQSRTNKIPGPGQQPNLQEEKELRQGSVSLAEIDWCVPAGACWPAPRTQSLNPLTESSRISFHFICLHLFASFMMRTSLKRPLFEIFVLREE